MSGDFRRGPRDQERVASTSRGQETWLWRPCSCSPTRRRLGGGGYVQRRVGFVRGIEGQAGEVEDGLLMGRGGGLWPPWEQFGAGVPAFSRPVVGEAPAGGGAGGLGLRRALDRSHTTPRVVRLCRCLCWGQGGQGHAGTRHRRPTDTNTRWYWHIERGPGGGPGNLAQLASKGDLGNGRPQGVKVVFKGGARLGRGQLGRDGARRGPRGSRRRRHLSLNRAGALGGLPGSGCSPLPAD